MYVYIKRIIAREKKKERKEERRERKKKERKRLGLYMKWRKKMVRVYTINCYKKDKFAQQQHQV